MDASHASAHRMGGSTLRTYTLPALPNQANRIATATTVPVRVVLRNDAAVPIFIANELETLTGDDAPGSTSWSMNPDDEEIFILAPGQPLFAIGAGEGAILKVAISEALPQSKLVL